MTTDRTSWTRALAVAGLLAAFAPTARAGDAAPSDALRTERVSLAAAVSSRRQPAKKPKKTGDRKAKRAADRKAKKNYGTGQTIAATGVVVGTAGLVVLGLGSTSGQGFTNPGMGTLNLSAGLLTVGGLVGSSGALGAGIAVDGASKRPAPVIAGALGLPLGIFGATFFGVGLGLQEPGFAWAAIGTGAASTALATLQLAQNGAHRPKRWLRPRIDPMRRTVGLVGRF